MRHITNNVNAILLIIIIILAGSVVAYNHQQDTITREIIDENKQVKQELSEMKQDLTTKEERLRETFAELQRQLQDSVKFESLYTNISGERENLNASLAEMTEKWQDELTRRRAEEFRAQNLSTQLQTRTIELQVAERALAGCMSSLNSCREQLSS
jgi:septal ring factor EnvC (AmiA/AmiB activator)